MQSIDLVIENNDIRDVDSDVVILKYAQDFYGADEAVINSLNSVGINEKEAICPPGSHRILNTLGGIKAKKALFLGVPELLYFNYTEIRNFTQRALYILKEYNDIQHIALTIHGPGYGLDEVESFLSILNGILHSILLNVIPPRLRKISIVDRDSRRVINLRNALSDVDVFNSLRIPEGIRYFLDTTTQGLIIEGNYIDKMTGGSEQKPHIFVAIPFSNDFDDIFYYGIQKPVRESGYRCERIDQNIFTGDILDKIKQRISTARFVIGELTGANPNVYLEIGFAWGKNIPTILLKKKGDELKFDVRGQRCLIYENIQDLEQKLLRELEGLI